jgi:hypothetical protein
LFGPKNVQADDVLIENMGESLDNLLKIYYVKKHYPDVSLFVHASPVSCCPALITGATARELEQNTGTPVVSIPARLSGL